MKKLWLVPMMLLLATTTEQNGYLGKIKGVENYEAALKTAKETGKPVLLIFGTKR